MYALIMASRKLQHYFQERMIKVKTNQPLKKIFFKPDLSRRLVTCAVELSQYHIEYQARSAVKGQALADFLWSALFPRNGCQSMKSFFSYFEIFSLYELFFHDLFVEKV